LNSALTQAEARSILDGLENSDGEVRRLAVEQLPQLPIEEAVLLLAERLGDEVWRVRKAAVECLVRWADHSLVQEILIASLADGEDPGRRNSAFEALVACGTKVTPRLIAELTNPDVDVRKLVIDALAGIADPASKGSLIDAISDPDTNVRAAATEALGVVGGAPEAEHLLRAVNAEDDDLLVRLSALRALARLETSVSVGMLGSALDESALRPSALTLLGSSEDGTAVEVLLKALEGKNPRGREAAMAALLRQLSRLDGVEGLGLRDQVRTSAAASDQLIESACEQLESANLATRMVLVQFLGLLDDARVVVPILTAGRDEAIEELADTTLESMGEVVATAFDSGWDDLESDLKCRACETVGRLGGEAAERRLVTALGSDDPELRCAAATALGQSSFLRCLPDLARCLEAAARSDQFDAQEEIDVLMAAIVGMAERSEVVEADLDSELIDVLSGRLRGAPEPVRLVIARVLSRLGRPQDGEIIAYLLKDESAAVRGAAVKALSSLDFSQSHELLCLALGDESESVRIAAAIVLGSVDDIAAVEDLERMTHDQAPHVVAVAIRSMGHLHAREGTAPEQAYPMLREGLEQSAIVALASLEALTELGGEGAGTLAISAISRTEPEVLRAVVACVDKHGSDENLASLLPLVPHEDWSVRAEVVRVLAVRRYRKALPTLLRRLELEDDAFVREAVLDAIRELEE
jgi:HEAT repeat protein